MDYAAVHSLPDDPRLLKTLLIERAQLLGHRESRIVELEKQNQRIAELELDKLRLQQQLLVALKKLYGPRGDSLSSAGDVAQLLLEFAVELEARPVEDLPPDADAGQIDSKTIRRVKRRGRRDLGSDEFDHLPVIRKEHDLTDADKPCPCCNQPRAKIGEESSWQIEYIPGSFQRIEHVRIKYACRDCEQNASNPNIVLADKPVQPIEKGMAGPGLLAYVNNRWFEPTGAVTLRFRQFFFPLLLLVDECSLCTSVFLQGESLVQIGVHEAVYPLVGCFDVKADGFGRHRCSRRVHVPFLLEFSHHPVHAFRRYGQTLDVPRKLILEDVLAEVRLRAVLLHSFGAAEVIVSLLGLRRDEAAAFTAPEQATVEIGLLLRTG